MYYFRKILISSVFLIFLSNFSYSQWIFGGGMKYNTNEQFKAIAPHLKIGKDISDKFDINVDLGYYLSKKATYTFDVDLHYRLFNIADKVLINPLAGINFTRTENFRNSLLLGMSLRILGDRYTYYIEPKYILNDNQYTLGIGILL